jgi:formylmethanofuran dehydrogenase subunit E
MNALCRCAVVLLALALCAPPQATSETREEWVKIGERIHGGFGTFVPLGIRIGLDALERLGAKPREVSVLYLGGAKSPCPCIADGVMLATMASPGQGTLTMSTDTAPRDALAVVLIRHRKTGQALRYTIGEAWLPVLLGWNTAYDPPGRYDVIMRTDHLFSVQAEP